MIYVFCQGFNRKPSGGIKVLFDIVKVLNANGMPSTILIPGGEYKLDWLDYEVPVENDINKVTKNDLLVLHEETLWIFNTIVGKTNCKYVILNQGAHWSLTNYLGYEKTKAIYEKATGILANSDYTSDLIKRLFGNLNVKRFHIGIPDYFCADVKRDVIAYMPRHKSETSECIVQYVKDFHSDWELVSIDEMHYTDVAKTLASSKIFLSFSRDEGFGMPPLEAALSGCKVIGWDGFGGREYFKSPLFTPTPYMEIPQMLDSISEWASLLVGKSIFDVKGALEQHVFLKSLYSDRRFNDDIINFFTGLNYESL